MKVIFPVIIIFFVAFSIVQAHAEITGHIPESDNSIMILQHNEVEYPAPMSGEIAFHNPNTPFAYKLTFIEGEIVNLSDHILSDIRIKIKFYENEKIEEVIFHPTEQILEPKEISYFSVQLPLRLSECYDILVDSYEFGSGDKIFNDLEIESLDIVLEKPEAFVKVKNNAKKSLEVEVLLVGYDENDKIKFGLYSNPERISSGSTKSLEFVFNDKFAPALSPEFRQHFVAEKYKATAISIKYDVTGITTPSKFHKIIPINELHQSKHYPNDLEITYDLENYLDVKTSSCFGHSSTNNIIPQWIKDNTKSWLDKKITDHDMIGSLQYLIRNNIIFLPNDSTFVVLPRYMITDDEFTPNIFGRLANDVPFMKGINAEFKMINPDGIEKKFTVPVTKDKTFNGIISLELDSSTGKYNITGSYVDNYLGEGYFTIIESGDDFEQLRVFPVWTKQNMKWWVEGLISDRELVDLLQFLINKGITKV